MLKRFPDGKGRTRQRGRGKKCFIFPNSVGNLQERQGGFRWHHTAVGLDNDSGKPSGLWDVQPQWPLTLTAGSPRGQRLKICRQITAVSPPSSEEAVDLDMAVL